LATEPAELSNQRSTLTCEGCNLKMEGLKSIIK